MPAQAGRLRPEKYFDGVDSVKSLPIIIYIPWHIYIKNALYICLSFYVDLECIVDLGCIIDFGGMNGQKYS
jgi:hypothetical protein